MNRHFGRSLVYLPLLLLIGLSLLTLAAEGPTQVFHGTLVDITCATDPKRDLSKLRSEHSRKCLLMPVCIQSGYALLTDHDEVLRFDATGNEIARKLIQKGSRTKDWRVFVSGAIKGDQLSVRQISRT
jgi:hypothetical protein